MSQTPYVSLQLVVERIHSWYPEKTQQGKMLLPSILYQQKELQPGPTRGGT